MLSITDGVPGAGKTYRTVHYLLSQFCDVSGTIKGGDLQAVPKDGVVIITNIRGLKVDHLDLDVEISNCGSLVDYFSYDHMSTYLTDYSTIFFAIDEAQLYFRHTDNKKLVPTFEYFEKHRHLGHELYFTTQKARKIARDILDLPEFIISARSPSRSFTGEFRYIYKSDGVQVNSETIRPRKDYFALYKTAKVPVRRKVNKHLIKLLFMFIGLLGFAWIVFHFFFFAPSESNTSSSSAVSSPRPPNDRGDSSYDSKSQSYPASSVHFIKLSTISEYSSRFSQPFVRFFWAGGYYSYSDFPGKIIKKGRYYYVVLDQLSFDAIQFSTNSDKPHYVSVRR